MLGKVITTKPARRGLSRVEQEKERPLFSAVRHHCAPNTLSMAMVGVLHEKAHLVHPRGESAVLWSWLALAWIMTDMCQHRTPARLPRPCHRPSLTLGLGGLSWPRATPRRFGVMASEEGARCQAGAAKVKTDTTPCLGCGKPYRRVWESAPGPAPLPNSLPSMAIKTPSGLQMHACKLFPFCYFKLRALIFCHFGRSGETKRSGAVA